MSGKGIPFPSVADPFFLVFPWLSFVSLMALTREHSVVTGLALLLIGGATFLRQRLELRENALFNHELQAVNASLEAQEIRHSNEESRRRTHEVTLLNELLQMCVSFEEVSSVIARMCPHFFPDASGALYLTNAPRNLVKRSAVWGARNCTDVFAPADCWALRRGRDHLVAEDGIAPRCTHLPEDSGTYLCIPPTAQGEALGLLHLNTPHNAAMWQNESGQRLARTFGDAVALALSNLRLRETLRHQSIRDPLTRLFNRRYLEETLERELRRAARANLNRSGDLRHRPLQTL